MKCGPLNCTSPQLTGNIILLLAVFGATFCLTPLFVLDYGGKYTVDDVVYHRLENRMFGPQASVLASFFISIVPAADLLLDLPGKIMSYFYPVEKSTKQNNRSNVVRLTEIERLIFIVGIALQSTVCFVPSYVDQAIIGLVHDSTNNCSIILVFAPIIVFLERCTTTFTPLRAFVIVFIFIIGLMVATICNWLRFTGAPYGITLGLGSILAAISALLYLLTTFSCAVKYFRTKLGDADSRHSFLSSISVLCKSPFMLANSRISLPIDKDIELYTNYIPALHMISSIIIGSSLISLAYTSHSYAPLAMERKNYLVLAAEVMVLVIELRIRKNEIARGLIALLESKKSYVRYISHELRTPLNTAFLGLKLLTTELKKSSDAKDIERYDTLCDVNMSCTAAVDILNDLLCYEKLECGILELHKEDITIEPFLNDCVSMFSVQARECGVTMTIIFEPTHQGNMPSCSNDSNDSSRPLQPADTVYADKFKMYQVFRNLISNALKFTPKDGTVSIKAIFVYDKNESTTYFRSLPRQASLSDLPNNGMVKQKSARKLSNNSVLPHHQNTPFSSDALYNGKLVVVVTDTGAGISVENQGRLFKEIVQFSPEKLQAGGGSGLGLWITRGIMDLHDGNISVSSEGEGMGSSFTVEIPMRRREIAPEIFRQACEPSPNSDSETVGGGVCQKVDRRKSIFKYESNPSLLTSSIELTADTLFPTGHAPTFDALVVDDSRLNRKMLMKCLRADGHTCVEVADGLEAVEMVKERIDHANGGHGKPFDAILMDFIMPNMDGPTATKQIRALGYTAPIFGVTGNGLPADIDYFIDCGADKVLLKPLDIREFGLAMRQMKEKE